MNPRQRRLYNDYRDMEDLRDKSRGIIDFRVSNNYQHYDVEIRGIRTLVITARGVEFRDNHRFTIDLPPEYPLQAPIVRFMEPIFHPNWYPDGRVCYGTQWAPGDKLSELVIDTIKMMTYDIVNTRSPANGMANEWYLQNRERIRNIIPKVQFPPPSEEGLEIYEEKEGELEIL